LWQTSQINLHSLECNFACFLSKLALSKLLLHPEWSQTNAFVVTDTTLLVFGDVDGIAEER
jgi:hypothetical protein